MDHVSPQRVVAVSLFVIAFLALAASRAFPFLDDMPGVVETVIVAFGAMCALVGVGLWLRKTPDAKE
ncbi:hypothetical protein AB0J83_42605 [Actinoplanes sp. NPDC049596]|uniref:hypothetical protein n=1 Tax=unclassified Actinoplanes TaxID=2626549 RepID=UPI00343263C5